MRLSWELIGIESYRRPAAAPTRSGDDSASRSCAILVKDVKPGDKIVTIEGLSRNGDHPVQKAWLALDVPQCGYCQAGQIMAATALLKKKPKPTDADIDAAMTNICRCGTYQRIRAAVRSAAGGGAAEAPLANSGKRKA